MCDGSAVCVQRSRHTAAAPAGGNVCLHILLHHARARAQTWMRSPDWWRRGVGGGSSLSQSAVGRHISHVSDCSCLFSLCTSVRLHAPPPTSGVLFKRAHLGSSACWEPCPGVTSAGGAGRIRASDGHTAAKRQNNEQRGGGSGRGHVAKKRTLAMTAC